MPRNFDPENVAKFFLDFYLATRDEVRTGKDWPVQSLALYGV